MPNSKPKSPNPSTGFLFMRQGLGGLLKTAREAAGLSLRELEALSGVSHSEIFKLEKGSQSCRLESFVLVCGALGIPCGDLIDEAVFGNLCWYQSAIRADKDFKAQVKDNPLADNFADNLAVLASFSAHLIQCAKPGRKARDTEYPTKPLRERFLKLADALEAGITSTERREWLRILRDKPLTFLISAGMLDSEVLEAFGEWVERVIKEGAKAQTTATAIMLEAAGLPKNSPVWLPFYSAAALEKLMNPKSGGNTDLTKAETKSKSVADMKPQLPNLLERLKRAAAQPGKKSELANALRPRVPLASVSRWLSGEREPGGEVTLQLLQWVELQERK